jgi:hypothetical protein
MLASLEARLPAVFQKMVYKTVYDKALADARDKALEQQRQEQQKLELERALADARDKAKEQQTFDSARIALQRTDAPDRDKTIEQQSTVVVQQPAPQTEEPKVKKPRKKHGFYFAPKFMLEFGEYIVAPGFNAEIGWTYSNRMLFGIDFNLGAGGNGGMLGGGLSLGRVHDLPVPQMQLAYGGGVGLWFAGAGQEYYDNHGNHSGYDDRENWNFLAPFIRWRWKFIELSYRGLLGKYEKESRPYSVINGYSYRDYDYDDGFGWNNHQIMLGLYFGGR